LLAAHSPAVQSETADYERGDDGHRGQGDAGPTQTQHGRAERATCRFALVLTAHGEPA
jgi:hypothetical protein